MKTITVPTPAVVKTAQGIEQSFSIYDTLNQIWKNDPRLNASFAAIESGLRISNAFEKAQKENAKTIGIEQEIDWRLLVDIAMQPQGGYEGIVGGVRVGLGQAFYPHILAVKNATDT